MNQTCSSCISYELYQMIMCKQPYAYHGEIPCLECSRYIILDDKYVRREDANSGFNQLSGKNIEFTQMTC